MVFPEKKKKKKITHEKGNESMQVTMATVVN